MDNKTPIYSLTEVTEQYLLRKFNDRKKYFSRYFSIAGDIYQDVFRTIMPSVFSKYVKVEIASGEPFPFIWKPENMERFICVSVTNKAGNLAQLYYNDQLNVFSKPVKKKTCGCHTTDLCDCIDNLQVVIAPKVILGVTYYERTWVECCGNGDVLQYKEVPVQQYGTAGGSYSNDYGDDYDIINEGDNVVILRFTKNLGKLTTKDCGCVEDTPENQVIVFDKCGCFLPVKSYCCQQYYNKKINCYGEIKFSECGEKIYLRDVKADTGNLVIISYQPSAITCGEEVFIPSYARRAIWAGIEEETTIYYPRASEVSKQTAKNNRRSANIELFEYLNPFHAERAFEVHSEIKF